MQRIRSTASAESKIEGPVLPGTYLYQALLLVASGVARRLRDQTTDKAVNAVATQPSGRPRIVTTNQSDDDP